MVMPTTARSLTLLLAFVTFALPRAQAQVRDERPAALPPTLTVTGDGESSARPDRAVVRLGATAQAETASAAQEQVSRVMQDAIAAIREAGIREEMISTSGLSLQPVYSDQPPIPIEGRREPPPPRIVAYRANNSVRIVVDDLAKIGDVIDAGVKSGANQIEDLSFQLKDDAAARREALASAAKEARDKADAIAQAMGLRIEGVLDVSEGGVNVIRPRLEFARGAVAMDAAATPVQPGQVDVQASVTVTYRVSPADGAAER